MQTNWSSDQISRWLTPLDVAMLQHDWECWARPDQLITGGGELTSDAAAAPHPNPLPVEERGEGVLSPGAGDLSTHNIRSMDTAAGGRLPERESPAASGDSSGRLPARDSEAANKESCAPAWRTWLLLGGRGSGKTRAGAEWVRALALGRRSFTDVPVKRIALVGETIAEVRAVMVEGVSGLLAIHAPHERPTFEPSKKQLTWPNGAIAQLFSAEDPDSLRGPQFGAAWCDELAKWRYAERTWDMLQLALRIGPHPRQVVTTTPRPIALLKQLIADAATIISRSRTIDNAENLSASFLAEMRKRFGVSALARQELDGELVEDRGDALWKRQQLENARISMAPAMRRVVVAVDPPVTSGAKADACGIVVAGVGMDGRGYVLADRTIAGFAPTVWAKAAVGAFHEFEADRIVAEVNQGGELVEGVIRQVEPDVPVRRVRATRGKWLRAEPVAALYERGMVSHAGAFPALEDQMCDYGPDGLTGGRSPDRMDALVWALTDLMLTRGGEPRVRAV